ncbi:Cell wall protein Awa1p [Winogradskyella psychrotolerans RS-3]|uniref:Cell wall protein Awa1p n=2 Tax=Winogradskyella TaxID=286104 RepID=S7WU49_9FLAO|nr:Cell wall protein Awa1p [Winogradskyella psychrotolerans RS-3]
MLCVLNLSNAQQEQTGYDIQNEQHDQYGLNDQNTFDPTIYESEFNLEDDFNSYESTESDESNLENQSTYTLENDAFEKRDFDVPVLYTYNNGWLPSDPLLGGIAVTDLIIVEAGDINITENLSLATLTIEAGASVTIGSDVVVTASVILNSTAEDFSSLILDGKITGTITYNRHTAQANPNELVSAPLSGKLFAAFAVTNNLNLASHPDTATIKAFAPFNTSTQSYDNLDTVINETHILDAGNGYRAGTVSGGADLIYIGAAQTADVLDIAISDAGNAWNLIGNPYPSYLDFGAFYTVNSSELDASSSAIYCYTGNGAQPWDIWNSATAAFESGSKLISPGEAFFIKAKSEGGSIDFTTGMRAVGTSRVDLSREGVSPHYGHIKLKLSSGSSNYNTDFYFNSNASEGLDPGYDASLFGSNPPAFSIYSSLIDGDANLALAIQALSNTDMSNVVVPLGVNANQGEELTFSIIESDMSDSTNMYLEDNVNNTVTLLNTSDYIFTPATDLSGTGRFYLRFETSTLSTIDVDVELVKIYANNAAKTININGQLQNNTVAKLFDTNGRLVLSNVLNTNNTSQSIDVSQLSSGVYIVELDNNTNERRIEKLIIR